MVFFSCDGCGDMLKKNQVDAHVYRCRDGCHAVSCVDCSVSFPGDDYRTHTSCISEAERYEKTVYRGPRKGDGANNGAKKKRSPQEAWMDVIASAASSAPSSIRSHVERLSMLDNVPRKEKAFRNFTANSLGLRGRDAGSIVEAMWKHLSSVREEEQKKMAEGKDQKGGEGKPREDEENAESNVAKEESPQDGKTDDDRPRVEAGGCGEAGQTNDAEATPESDVLTPKAVIKAMKKELKRAPDRRLKLKALRKSVQERLLIKGREKDLKKLIKQQLGDTGKMKLDGKYVCLV